MKTPDEIAEKVSSIVSTECKDASVDEYVEACEASIAMLQTDIQAARGQ